MRDRPPRVRAPRGGVAAMVLALAAVVAAAVPARGDIEPDEHGQIAVLPGPTGAHWVWVPDRVLRHATLFDGDTGRALGTLDGSFTLSGPTMMFSARRQEIYVIDPVYSRGHRGERKDYVTIYDATTLAVRGEVEIRRAPRASATATSSRPCSTTSVFSSSSIRTRRARCRSSTSRRDISSTRSSSVAARSSIRRAAASSARSAAMAPRSRSSSTRPGGRRVPRTAKSSSTRSPTR